MASNVTAPTREYPVIDTVEALQQRMKEMRKAQQEFATYTQEQVDKIFFAAAMAANKARIPLAKMAVEETGMGVVEDKVIKNHYASEYIYNAYRNTKTCGVIEEDSAYGIKKIAEPIGLIAAVIPTTNPTSTAIFKTLICLKTRNAIIISPHPRAKASTIAAAKVVYEAAVAAGAAAIAGLAGKAHPCYIVPGIIGQFPLKVPDHQALHRKNFGVGIGGAQKFCQPLRLGKGVVVEQHHILALRPGNALIHRVGKAGVASVFD